MALYIYPLVCSQAESSESTLTELKDDVLAKESALTTALSALSALFKSSSMSPSHAMSVTTAFEEAKDAKTALEEALDGLSNG